jgi:hypothetical protein
MTVSATAFITDPELLGQWFAGESWWNWLIMLKACFAEPMTEAEQATFRELAERDPPERRVREAWFAIGRRGGKDSVASAVATYAATAVDYSGFLRPGERATILCIAVDREQAGIVLKYIQGYFAAIPMLGEQMRSARASRRFPSRAAPPSDVRCDSG